MELIWHNRNLITLYVVVVYVVELLYAYKHRAEGKFSFHHLCANLAINSIKSLNLFLVLPCLLLYIWIFNATSSWHISLSKENGWHWIFAFIVVDFSFYFYHYASHNWNLMWGAHGVHHQPEEYNVSIAGRDGIFQGFFRIITILPLAALGIPHDMAFPIIVMSQLATLWLHSEAYGKLGILEYIIVTPSQHRVHHYKDLGPDGKTKNLGSILSIWDRLFGSFQAESIRGQKEYGITEASPIFSPWKCQVHFYNHLFAMIAKYPRDTFKILFTNYLPEPVPAVETDLVVRERRSWDWIVCVIAIYLCWHFITNFTEYLRLVVVFKRPIPSGADLLLLISSIIGSVICVSFVAKLARGLRQRYFFLNILIITILALMFLLRAHKGSDFFHKNSAYQIVESKVILLLFVPQLLILFEKVLKRVRS